VPARETGSAAHLAPDAPRAGRSPRDPILADNCLMRLPPPPGRLIDVGGHRLHLHCEGTGAAVVMDAALGASSLSWTYVRPEVAAFARACAYDRAGFGWSDAGPLPRTVARIVEELQHLLAAAAVPRPYVLVGHSFGGLVARAYVHRHPGEIGGLVLLDPAYPEDWLDPCHAHAQLISRGVRLCRYGRQAARIGITDAVAALARRGALGSARTTALIAGRGLLKRVDEEVLAPAARLPREARAVAQRFWTRPQFFEALGSQIESISASAASVPVDQSFGDLPVVVVSGELNSDAGQLARQQRLVARSTRGRHVVAERSGHWIPLDRPDVVVDAIRDVVAEIHKGTGTRGT
jgi:pimeloyl-ACP methyl ester carboxylesterase